MQLSSFCNVLQDVYGISLIFSRSGYRFINYACKQASVLLNLNKQVFVFSPDWQVINDYLTKHHPTKTKLFYCNHLGFLPKSTSIAESLLSLVKLKNRLHAIEKQFQCKSDLVLFCPVEDWFNPNTPAFLIDKTFNFKWSGLFLKLNDYYQNTLTLNKDPKIGECDYFFTAKNCIGVTIIDRFISKQVQSRVYKKTIVFPDVTFAESNKPYKKANQIKAMAKNRMVVGTMQIDSQNLTNFFTTLLAADTDNYFFVCAGSFEPNQLTETETNLLKKLLEKHKDNYYLLLHDLKNQEEVNAILNAFDVIYLNDGDYHNPHPLLTKAAILHKPVIASKHDLIGKLVATFKTGICVGNTVSENLNALNMLRMQMPFDKNFDISKLDNYAQLQDEDALIESIEELILF